MPSPGHVALLGDSIFDNRAYTGDQPDVITHLRMLLPERWTATLLAVDGATIGGLAGQFARVPEGATHLVLSAGGNDALMNSDLLAMPLRSSSDALRLFAARLGPSTSHIGQRSSASYHSDAGRLSVPSTMDGSTPSRRRSRASR